jgi:hypothetical protein
MTNRRLKLTNALMPFIAGVAVGIGGVWVTGNAKVFGVVGLIAATIGVGLVGYGVLQLASAVLASDPEGDRR